MKAVAILLCITSDLLLFFFIPVLRRGVGGNRRMNFESMRDLPLTVRYYHPSMVSPPR